MVQDIPEIIAVVKRVQLDNTHTSQTHAQAEKIAHTNTIPTHLDNAPLARMPNICIFTMGLLILFSTPIRGTRMSVCAFFVTYNAVSESPCMQ